MVDTGKMNEKYIMSHKLVTIGTAVVIIVIFEEEINDDVMVMRNCPYNLQDLLKHIRNIVNLEI